MFSKELEELIEAALEDGVITDKERSILRKRAEMEHYGRDEFDMLLDARLNMKKRQEKKELSESLMLNHTNDESEPFDPNMTSSKKFKASIQKIISKWDKIIAEESLKDKRDKYEKDCEAEVKNYISLFPVPTKREDLLDFINVLAGMRHDSKYDSEYIQKFKETLNKAETAYGTDPQFAPLIERYSKISWENLSTIQRIFIGYAIAVIICLFISYIMN